MPKRLLKSCRRELKLNNCGFDHDPAESLMRSQWQARSKNNFYLLYRWLVAIFVIFVVCVAIYDHLKNYSIELFFVYLTHQGVIVNMIVGIMGAVLVTMWYFHPDFKDNLLQNGEMPTSFKIYWALHNVALITSFVITIVYWGLLHNENIPLNAANILCHACNSALLFLDILIVAHQLRLYHVIQPIIFGVSYGIFSYIYYICGGKGITGTPYIYKVLDWTKPQKAMVMVFGTLFLAITVHIILFWIYKICVFIQRRFFGTELILPTTKSSKYHSGKSLGSQISMVFGENDGCTNEAFKTTPSIVFK